MFDLRASLKASREASYDDPRAPDLFAIIARAVKASNDKPPWSSYPFTWVNKAEWDALVAGGCDMRYFKLTETAALDKFLREEPENGRPQPQSEREGRVSERPKR